MTEVKIDGRSLRTVRPKKDSGRTRGACISLTPEVHATMLRIGKAHKLSLSTMIQAMVIEIPEVVLVDAAVKYSDRINSDRKVSAIAASKQLGGISAKEIEMIRKRREGN